MATNDDTEGWLNELYTPDTSGLMGDPMVGSFLDRPQHANDAHGRFVEADEGYMMLANDDYSPFSEDGPKYVNSAATQTSAYAWKRARKIKPVKRPGLVLKTPIAYERDTDPSVIPIEKDGMAVCEQCGAIGVKHAFYTKLRRFCSQACAREYGDGEKTLNSRTLDNDSSSSVMSETTIPADLISKKMKTECPDYMEAVPAEFSQELFPFECTVDIVTAANSPKKGKQLEKPIPGTYQWAEAMNDLGFQAAPVMCFKHAPGFSAWHYISIGMKVEVENTDCEDHSELLQADSFWVASVLRISGYCILLRYIGFAKNSEKDFWVNFCSTVVHPVGWCAMRGKPLIPPKSIEYRYLDWKRVLSKTLSGGHTLPSNFVNKVQSSLESRFRVNMVVEVVDKNRISQVKVATVNKIVGKRLQVRYYDSEPDDNGFVCHEDSPLLHPVGWARAVGANIDAPQEYTERCNGGQWAADDATVEFFIDSEYAHPTMEDSPLKVGMKLEAIDPLNLSSICVATVMQELQENFVMIRIDSYTEDSTNSDWFCYHASSPCIFPAGFCDVNNITLTPPKGFTADTFNWTDYLVETGLTTAPLTIFHREIPNHGFKVGMRLEAADLMDPRLVCVGTVARVVGRLLKVHFDGWDEEYDQWLDCESPDIYPVGWCDAVRHKLEGPRSVGNVKGAPPAICPGKSARGVKRKVGRRHKKGKPACPLSGGGGKAVRGCSVSPPSEAAPSAAASAPAAVVKCVQAVQPTADNGAPDGNGQAIEPEMGQEPAGPDQSLPVSTEPNQLPGMPRERTATSYINSTGSTGKLIPRLVDGTGTTGTEPGELVPNEWNVYDVAQFLRVNDCATYCDSFSKRKIDGKTLINLSKDQIIDLTGMKVGPSLKIFDLIQQLKIKVNPAAERLKAFKKTIS